MYFPGNIGYNFYDNSLNFVLGSTLYAVKAGYAGYAENQTYTILYPRF